MLVELIELARMLAVEFAAASLPAWSGVFVWDLDRDRATAVDIDFNSVRAPVPKRCSSRTFASVKERSRRCAMRCCPFVARSALVPAVGWVCSSFHLRLRRANGRDVIGRRMAGVP